MHEFNEMDYVSMDIYCFAGLSVSACTISLSLDIISSCTFHACLFLQLTILSHYNTPFIPLVPLLLLVKSQPNISFVPLCIHQNTHTPIYMHINNRWTYSGHNRIMNVESARLINNTDNQHWKLTGRVKMPKRLDFYWHIKLIYLIKCVY